MTTPRLAGFRTESARRAVSGSRQKFKNNVQRWWAMQPVNQARHTLRLRATRLLLPRPFKRTGGPAGGRALKGSPAAQWVAEIAGADGIDPKTIRSAGLMMLIAGGAGATPSPRSSS